MSQIYTVFLALQHQILYIFQKFLLTSLKGQGARISPRPVRIEPLGVEEEYTET